MSGLYFSLSAIRQVQNNPPQAIESRLRQDIAQVRQEQSVLPKMVDVQRLECSLRSVESQNTTDVSQLRSDLNTKVKDYPKIAEIADKIQKLESRIQTAPVSNSDADAKVLEISSKLQRLESRVQTSATQTNSNTDARIRELSDKTKMHETLIRSAAVKAEQSLNNTLSLNMTSRQLTDRSNFLFQDLDTRAKRLADAYNGNMSMSLADEDEDVSAALLNAATVGTFTKTVLVALIATYGEGEIETTFTHVWAELEPVLTPAEDCDDAQIGVPTVPANVSFTKGVASFVVTFDTDAGVTKTYAPGDAVTVKIQVTADDTLLGWSVPFVTKTYNVIA